MLLANSKWVQFNGNDTPLPFVCKGIWSMAIASKVEKTANGGIHARRLQSVGRKIISSKSSPLAIKTRLPSSKVPIVIVHMLLKLKLILSLVEAGATSFPPFLPRTFKQNRSLSTPIYFTAFTNSSAEIFACLRMLCNVPIATSPCIGTTQPTLPSGVDFFITTWLPR